MSYLSPNSGASGVTMGPEQVPCPTCGCYVDKEVVERSPGYCGVGHWKAMQADLERDKAERSQLMQTLAERLAGAERLKMSYDRENYDNDYFEQANLVCYKHADYKCTFCLRKSEVSERKKMEEENNNELSLIVAEPKKHRESTKEEAKENFGNQVDFVKTALNMTDKGMDKVKVKDLKKKVKEAHNKITIGQMKKLFNERIKDKGIVQTISFKLAKFLGL